MVRQLLRKWKYIQLKNQLDDTSSQSESQADVPISSILSENERYLYNVFQCAPDIVYRKISVGPDQEAVIINIDGLSDKQLMSEGIFKAIMWEDRYGESKPKVDIEHIRQEVIKINSVSELVNMQAAVNAVLKGNAVLFLDGCSTGLSIGVIAFEHRGVEPPQTEVVVRGSREGFTENIRTNTALLRRRIKDPDLRIEKMIIGTRTQTEVNLVYISNLVNDELVEEVRRRLKTIKIDAILESGYIEEFIEDHPLSIFPTISNTESPDKLSSKLLEGRVGILTDGTPFALAVPLLCIENFQVSEDYYSRPYLTSMLRMVRFFALHVSIFLPALYVAATTFHPALFPTQMLMKAVSAHQGIPFPIAVEALIMIIIFEGLREAGIRLPRPVGQAVSIVGALILGEAAISAGISSAPIVIIVGMTGIAGFILPPQTDPVTILRIPVLLVTSIFGIFGMVCCYLMIVVHVLSLRSFGVPYLYPVAPFHWRDWKDFIIRVHWRKMNTRPSLLNRKDDKRSDP
jgi:spore germination protein KA